MPHPPSAEPKRAKYAPTPRQPGVPPTMRVQVELGFVQSCPDCRAISAKIAQSCIGDPTVSGFRLVPGRKHAHDVVDATGTLTGAFALEHTPEEIAAAAQELVSDTNGSAPEAVERALFEGLSPVANGLGRPNGFDHEAKARA